MATKIAEGYIDLSVDYERLRKSFSSVERYLDTFRNSIDKASDPLDTTKKKLEGVLEKIQNLTQESKIENMARIEALTQEASGLAKAVVQLEEHGKKLREQEQQWNKLTGATKRLTGSLVPSLGGLIGDFQSMVDIGSNLKGGLSFIGKKGSAAMEKLGKRSARFQKIMNSKPIQRMGKMFKGAQKPIAGANTGMGDLMGTVGGLGTALVAAGIFGTIVGTIIGKKLIEPNIEGTAAWDKKVKDMSLSMKQLLDSVAIAPTEIDKQARIAEVFKYIGGEAKKNLGVVQSAIASLPEQKKIDLFVYAEQAKIDVKEVRKWFDKIVTEVPDILVKASTIDASTTMKNYISEFAKTLPTPEQRDITIKFAAQGWPVLKEQIETLEAKIASLTAAGKDATEERKKLTDAHIKAAEPTTTLIERTKDAIKAQHEQNSLWGKLQVTGQSLWNYVTGNADAQKKLEQSVRGVNAEGKTAWIIQEQYGHGFETNSVQVDALNSALKTAAKTGMPQLDEAVSIFTGSTSPALVATFADLEKASPKSWNTMFTKITETAIEADKKLVKFSIIPDMMKAIATEFEEGWKKAVEYTNAALEQIIAAVQRAQAAIASIQSGGGGGGGGGAIQSFQQGGVVPQTGQYRLHEGEFVVPTGSMRDINVPANQVRPTTAPATTTTTNISPTFNISVTANIARDDDLRQLARKLSDYMNNELYRRYGTVY